MAYKVSVRYKGLRRDYGTGKEGIGGAYKTNASAEKRASALKRKYADIGAKVTIVRVG
jgi:hypothetical protein